MSNLDSLNYTNWQMPYQNFNNLNLSSMNSNKLSLSNWNQGTFNWNGNNTNLGTNYGWGFNNPGWGSLGGVSSSNSSSSASTIEELDEFQSKEYEKNKNAWAQKIAQKNQSSIFKGLTKQEEKILINYHAKKQEYVENLGNSLAIGAGMGIVLPNMNNITHGFSASKAAFSKNSTTNQLFKDVVKKDIWKNETGILQEAYAQMHKAEVRANNWKVQGAFKRGFTTQEFDAIKNEMETALANGNKDDILEATAKLKNANSIREGWISRGFNSIKAKLGMTPKATVSAIDKMADNTMIQQEITNLAAVTNNSTFKGALKNSVGGKIGIAMAALGLISEAKYIKAGFKKDKKTGFKQLGQSVVKSGASWGGYILGDALGKWGGAKLGAMIGSAVCPGLGTAIGAVAGIICGTVASWGLRKLANWIVGDNVANELITKEQITEIQVAKEQFEKEQVENEKVAKETIYEQQQAQFLQEIISHANKDKNLDEKTSQVIQKVQNLYA